jgi:aspartokinase/homoserine dehydrogenase 1
MKVLIGTSVANAQNIKLVLDIVQNQAKQDQLIVVVSALSKVTDLLHLASLRAASTDESYKEIVADIEKTFRCRQRIDCRQ